ncbi:hypothetical protein ACROYT_G026974, partial [Oculina patagonica]
MFCRSIIALSIFVLVPVFSHSIGDTCVSLETGPFKMCMKAGYDKTVQFPEEFTEPLQEEVAMEMREFLKAVKNCSTSGLAEAIECSFVAPKCGRRGKPVYPCKQVCAEFLKHCELELSELELDYLISSCLVLSNGSSSCAPCFTPPNFTANESVLGPLDRGCQELIIPACKNLGAYNHTLTSVPVQKQMYSWFYEKNYTEDSAETEFPEFVRNMFEQYPKCQENIKKIFCGEYLPPCFPDEGPRPYSLCQPLCHQMAKECPEIFSHDIMVAAEYCSTMAKGQTKHGYCQSTEWPAAFSWIQYVTEEATKAPSVVPESHGTKAWVIIIAVLLSLLIVGLVVTRVIWWKKSRDAPGVAYTKHYDKQAEDSVPLETEAD